MQKPVFDSTICCYFWFISLFLQSNIQRWRFLLFPFIFSPILKHSGLDLAFTIDVGFVEVLPAAFTSSFSLLASALPSLPFLSLSAVCLLWWCRRRQQPPAMCRTENVDDEHVMMSWARDAFNALLILLIYYSMSCLWMISSLFIYYYSLSFVFFPLSFLLLSNLSIVYSTYDPVCEPMSFNITPLLCFAFRCSVSWLLFCLLMRCRYELWRYDVMNGRI